MRKTRTLALSCAALAAAGLMAATPASAQFLSGVRITPGSPTDADLVTANVSGFFPSTGFSFVGAAAIGISGQDITITLRAQGPAEAGLTVLVPFDLPVNLGRLSAGSYTETVNLFAVNPDILKASFSSSFSVVPAAPVPEPASALLLGLGLAGVMGLRGLRGRRATQRR